MNTWWPARQGLAAFAVFAAILTGTFGAALGGSGGHAFLAGAYVVAAAVALFYPAAIAVQVIGGQVLLGSLLVGSEGTAPLLLVPAVAGVVVTAELLAVVARLDTQLERDPGDDLPRAGLAAVIGGAVFGAVVLVSGFPGPIGLVAVGLASGACVVLATLLVSNARPREPLNK